ncbi:hypothetical protein EK904_013875 [Melospiza melodia maxima]|nr:hypothetical protein EK904_013875 [Melospiza melodia maxima]
MYRLWKQSVCWEGASRYDEPSFETRPGTNGFLEHASLLINDILDASLTPCKNLSENIMWLISACQLVIYPFMGLRCEVTHLVDYWAKLDFWGVVSCDNRGCGAFRLLFSFKKLTPFASRKGNGFCFHSLIAHPVDHIDPGGTQSRHEAFWTHSCVFHSTDSGKHMLNSHQSLKRV